MTTPESAQVAFARRYLAAIERGAGGDALAEFFTPDIVQYEFPNRLVPNGATRDLGAILDAAVRGQNVTSSQRFEILNVIEDGNRLALEVNWSATLAVAFGSIPIGGEMRARFGVFLDFRDGKIAAQRNYDCFDPW